MRPAAKLLPLHRRIPNRLFSISAKKSCLGGRCEKRIFATPNDIFSGGNAIYCWRNAILAGYASYSIPSQCSKKQMDFRIFAEVHFSITFLKNMPQLCQTKLYHCGLRISLCATHYLTASNSYILNCLLAPTKQQSEALRKVKFLSLRIANTPLQNSTVIPLQKGQQLHLCGSEMSAA